MRIALLGLGKMGANMARRLARHNIEVVGLNRSQGIVDELAADHIIIPARTLTEVVEKLTAPRVVWLMLPAGITTEEAINQLVPLLSKGDVIVDGGNSNYHDSVRRGQLLAQHEIGYMDAGTSGGIWGLENGYCLMVGGSKATVDIVTPVLAALAPAPDRGWAHVGPIGAGHYTKMIHNGIEYGMMQAYSEGFTMLHRKEEFALDLAQITELWRHSSVVRSWLLDLTAQAFKVDETANPANPAQKPAQILEALSPYVEDSGEGRWTVIEAIELGVAAPVITLAVQMRFASRETTGYGYRLLSLMRRAFGGHVAPTVENKS
ncbi:MAG: phosphogluconate dehydrogenase (NAD(+)-dependent, decarboxylating) [Gammaproteobacteria bacterium]